MEVELGFDAAILDGRVKGDFTYYKGKTRDALFPVRSVPSTGFQSSQLRNVGELENSGIEVGIDWQVLQSESVAWYLGVNVATNHSKVLDLGEATVLSMGNQGWLIEGEPLMVMRGTKLLNPDEIADPVVEKDHIFGPNNPTRIVGLNTSIELPYQITISARGEYQGRGLHGGRRHPGRDPPQHHGVAYLPGRECAHRRRSRGRATADQRFHCQTKFHDSEGFIQKADFFKLRNVSVRFPLPVDVPRASSAFVTLSAQNWFRWVNSDFPVFEPEMMSSSNPGYQQVRSTGTGVTPPPATFMASLRVVF